jgi:hypothetical protein
MMPRQAHVRDGGSSVDGVSRALLNKLVGKRFREGMRRPGRNGSPHKLEPLSSKLMRRHFLQARWRDPDEQEDLIVLQQIFKMMHRDESDRCIEVLREFSKSDHDAGLHVVRHHVRRCIEARRAQVERSFATENDDDSDEATLSTHSAAIQPSILRPTADQTAHRPTAAPAKPVDRVQAIHELIQETRRNSFDLAANADSAARLLPVASAHSSAQLSSCDLLGDLFRQMSSQQTRVAASSAQPQHPPATCLISGPILWSKPSAEDIRNASSARVELLCAKLCGSIR